MSTEIINIRKDLRDYPSDYEELFRLIHRVDETAEEEIHQNHFFCWLNKPDTPFSKIKVKALKKNLVLPADFIPTVPEEFLKKYVLERMCVMCAHYFMSNETTLQQVRSLKPESDKIRRYMQRIRDLSMIGTMPFENNIGYQLLLKSIDLLLLPSDTKRSVYSTGKEHPYLARELVTKRMLECLYRHFLEHDLTDHFILEMALTLTDQFFDTRMASDCRELALQIKANVIEQNQLWFMPIGEFLKLNPINDSK